MNDNNWTDTHRFDSKAAEWDASAVRAALADAVSRAIVAHMPVSPPARALEFGCGTGLVTLMVAPHCGTLVAADTSRGMLDVLGEKIAVAGIANVSPLLLDLSAPDAAKQLDGSFDFVFSSMVLHHIPETAPFLGQLNAHMNPGATLAIADLDAEDGLFHDDATEKVHFGFDRSVLTGMLQQAGFVNISFITAHVIQKKNRSGSMASYQVFLATATKPQQ